MEDLQGPELFRSPEVVYRITIQQKVHLTLKYITELSARLNKIISYENKCKQM